MDDLMKSYTAKFGLYPRDSGPEESNINNTIIIERKYDPIRVAQIKHDKHFNGHSIPLGF